MPEQRYNIAFLLSTLLFGVAMVTLVVTVVHIMQGDRDSVKKFLSWALVSSIGVALIKLLGGPQDDKLSLWEICVGVRNVIVDLGNLLRIGMLIGALYSLVIVISKMMKGDRESAEHVLYWLVAFAGGLVILSGLVALYE